MVALPPSRTEVRSGDAVPFTVVNTGPGNISFGTDYGMYRLERGAWAPCEGVWLFQPVLIWLSPRKRHKLAAKVPSDAPPGRYRVTKEVMTLEGPPVVGFEFSVLDDLERCAPRPSVRSSGSRRLARGQLDARSAV